MKHRVEVWLAAILALCAWGGLVWLMNLKPPTAANQALFLLVWGVAVSGTSALVYRAMEPRSTPWSMGRDHSARFLRRGALTGLLAFLLMGLRFMRLLTLIPAVLLTLLALTVEVSLTLRRR